MNCASCSKPLAKWELPQPMVVLGRRCWPDALCDSCAKAGQTRVDPPAAIEAPIA